MKCKQCGRECAGRIGDRHGDRVLCTKCARTHGFDRDGNIIPRHLLTREDKRQ